MSWLTELIDPSVHLSTHRSIAPLFVCLLAGWMVVFFLSLPFPLPFLLPSPFFPCLFPFLPLCFFLPMLYLYHAFVHCEFHTLYCTANGIHIYHYVIVVNPWQSRHDTCIISHRSLISLISFTFQWLSFLKHVQPNIMQCFVDGICIQGRNWRMVCNPVIPVWKAAKNSKPRKANHQMTFKSLNGECIQYFMYVYMIAYVHGILFCRSRPYQLCNSGPLDAILYDLEAVFNNMNLSLSLSLHILHYIFISYLHFICVFFPSTLYLDARTRSLCSLWLRR